MHGSRGTPVVVVWRGRMRSRIPGVTAMAVAADLTFAGAAVIRSDAVAVAVELHCGAVPGAAVETGTPPGDR